MLVHYLVKFKKIQNNHWTNISTRKMYLFYTKRSLQYVCCKHHRYDLFNFEDMQNDTDSITTLRIGQNFELVWQVMTDFWQISSYVNNDVMVYKEYVNCA